MKYDIEYEVQYRVKKVVEAKSMEEAEKLATEEEGELVKITVPVVIKK